MCEKILKYNTLFFSWWDDWLAKLLHIIFVCDESMEVTNDEQ